MNEQIARLRKDFARISRRTFFNSAGAAGAGWVAACALPNSAYADDDKDEGKGKGHDKEKDKDKDKNKGKECSEGVGPSNVCEMPNPIPHTVVTPFGPTIHNFFPGPVEGTLAATDPTGAHPNGRDPSPIFDFSGFIGQADLSLTGTGTDLTNGARAPYTFNADMRFMSGMFVGTDRRTRRGAFAFI